MRNKPTFFWVDFSRPGMVMDPSQNFLRSLDDIFRTVEFYGLHTDSSIRVYRMALSGGPPTEVARLRLSPRDAKPEKFEADDVRIFRDVIRGEWRCVWWFGGPSLG